MSLKFLLFIGLAAFAEVKTFQVSDAPEIRIPSKIWDLVQAQTKEESFSFASIKVVLKEKNDGVLLAPEISIELPRGGGQIDLSKYVRDTKGTFRVFFEIPELKALPSFQAFYVSNARKRRLDGELWGVGCQKFLTMTDYFISHLSDEGIEVNVTRGRHLTVLGGHFIFSAGQQITQVTFTDTTQLQMFCRQGMGPTLETE
jgi:hypothetical protein